MPDRMVNPLRDQAFKISRPIKVRKVVLILRNTTMASWDIAATMTFQITPVDRLTVNNKPSRIGPVPVTRIEKRSGRTIVRGDLATPKAPIVNTIITVTAVTAITGGSIKGRGGRMRAGLKYLTGYLTVGDHRGSMIEAKPPWPMPVVIVAIRRERGATLSRGRPRKRLTGRILATATRRAIPMIPS